MTDFVTLEAEAERTENRGFLVPFFELLIEGSGLPEGVLRDVTEFTYRDSLTEIDQFEVSVANWDAETRRFKYIGSETSADLARPDAANLPFKLFEPCRKSVSVVMGYVGNPITMMTGNFTTMEPSFPSSGPPVLTVRGLNALHELRRKKYSTAWVGKTPSFIARNIGQLNDGGARRFPASVEIVPGTESGEAPIPYVAQTSQYDIDFLLNFARQHGYELTLIGERGNRTIRFGRASDARLPVNYALGWGRALIEFKPTLTTAGQFKSVTVRGWDRSRQRPIEARIAFDDPALRGLNRDMHEMIIECDPREEQSVELPVFTEADARARAIAIMRDSGASIIKATGTTIGLPDLRSGTRVRIDNLGARLSGEYLVTKTTHTINDTGYTTRFEARREHFTGVER